MNTAPRDGTLIIATDTLHDEWQVRWSCGAWRIDMGRWWIPAWAEPRALATLISWRPA